MSTPSPIHKLFLVAIAISPLACDQPETRSDRVATALALVEEQRYDEALLLVDGAALSTQPEAEEEDASIDELVAEQDPQARTCMQNYFDCSFDGCNDLFGDYDDCLRTCYCIFTFCNGSSCFLEGV